MSLKPLGIPPVPTETARVARAAFPKGNIYTKLRERVGTVIHDEDFVALFAKDGTPGLPPWRLALVTILQFQVVSQLFPCSVFRYAAPLIVRRRRRGMVDFKGSQFEREISLGAVRWYVAYPISYRQLEEMMGERGVAVDHSTLTRGVIKYAPEVEKVFRRRQPSVGRSWRLEETSVKIKGKSAYLYRAVLRSVSSKWRRAGDEELRPSRSLITWTV